MMNNTAARALARQGFARSKTGRTYDVARASIVNTTPAMTSYSTQPPCRPCQQSLLTPAAPRPSSPGLPYGTRAFHASFPVHKSKKKQVSYKRGEVEKSADPSTHADEAGQKHPQPSPDEPLNFADVESRMRGLMELYKAAMKRMQRGRFDADAIGALQVTVDKAEGEAYPLRELAQVVPRGGRAVSLLVHEEAYVKPIMSAVQASPDFNQQPQRDPDNELELVLKIEPEGRDELHLRIKAAAAIWRGRVRAVRRKRDGLHSNWKGAGHIGPDDKRAADKELLKITRATIAELDDVEIRTIKALGEN